VAGRRREPTKEAHMQRGVMLEVGVRVVIGMMIIAALGMLVVG